MLLLPENAPKTANFVVRANRESGFRKRDSRFRFSSRARDTYYRERNRSRQNKGSESGFNFLKKPYPIFFKNGPRFLYFWGPFLKKIFPRLLSIVIGESFLPKVMRISDPLRCASPTPGDAHQRPPEMRITFSRALEDSPRASRGRQTRRRLGRVVWRFSLLGSVATISAPDLPTARRSRGYLPNEVSRVSGR